MINRPVVGVGALLLRGDKVLLGKRRGTHEEFYAVPGGHTEWGESFENTLRREVEEETGLEIQDSRFICILNHVLEDKHYVTLHFASEFFVGKPELKEPHKCEGWSWYDLDNLPEPMFIVSKDAIEHYKNGKII
jgi:8-oxo-dGTP diphosphatase